MKKWNWILAAAAALVLAGLWPVQGQDVARLQPVQTLICTWSRSGVTVEGEDGLQGGGSDLEAAMADLRAGADGVAFLDTASVVVACGELATAWPQLADCDQLRPAAQIYAAETAPDAEAAGEYLRDRKDGLTLIRLRADLAAGAEPRVAWLVETERGFRIAASEGNAAR